jgi:hypothetical protein
MTLKFSTNQIIAMQEYLEYEYEEVLEQLQDANEKLINLQEKAIQYATICKAALPADEGKIDNVAKENIKNYIYALAMFRFAGKVWSLIEGQLQRIVEALEKNDRYVYEDTEDLQELLAKIGKVPFDKLAEMLNMDLLKLEEVTALVYERMDFYLCRSKSGRGTWSFRDVTGTIKNAGFTNDLIISAYNEPIPAEITVYPISTMM